MSGQRSGARERPGACAVKWIDGAGERTSGSKAPGEELGGSGRPGEVLGGGWIGSRRRSQRRLEVAESRSHERIVCDTIKHWGSR